MRKLKITLYSIIILAMLVVVGCNKSIKQESIEDINTESNKKILSTYTYEVDITEEDEIDKIINDYSIENIDEKITKIIYVPFDNKGKEVSDKDNKYTIKHIKDDEKSVDLLYSSEFVESDGIAQIKRTMNTYNDFQNKCDKDELEKALEQKYALEVNEEYSIDKEYSIEMNDNKKVKVLAYEIAKVYSYEVLKNEEYVGEGKINKPMGMLVLMCQ